jgi:hypothetical protein
MVRLCCSPGRYIGLPVALALARRISSPGMPTSDPGDLALGDVKSSGDLGLWAGCRPDLRNLIRAELCAEARSASSAVLGMRDGFKVVRTDASANPAEMI